MIEIKKATQCCICNKFMAKGTFCESIKIGKTQKYFHASCYEALPKRGK
ncbi:MAG: hypothetical protein J6S67_26685 [Methanobrevibacter sp.]|nr:hypothetical protein [Methanobrevibacter sp.]